MLRKIINSFIGNENANIIKKIQPLVVLINQKFAEYVEEGLDKAQIKQKTHEFRNRLNNGETVDDLLPEAFGLVKYTAKQICGESWEVRDEDKVWEMTPYDVQLIGGIVLHQGSIAEMKTGEGKTLVCTMPAYLNALTGKGVYVVTVNEYLAKRDAEWMSGLYNALGLTVGTIYSQQPKEEKKKAYECDITYGTNNEFGFDYLRDNMATDKDNIVQRELHYAIVDEVDSILIDEARTPLIISAPAEASTEKYQKYAQLVKKLTENIDYNIDEKGKTATLTEEGVGKMETLLGIQNIYTEAGYSEVHHIEQALRAQAVYKRDQNYVIKDNKVIIVDEFTGRLMDGRRYGQGLHQAIEAKENVAINRESKTLATITFQNYFRLFEKLAGMTGTAETEKEEFYKIYGLDTAVIPTNKPIARKDYADNIYRNQEVKFIAVAKQVKELNEKGQPVLVGTASVEASEHLSKLFKANGIKHNVLNAKNHEREAEIISNAGKIGSVTIATNMAGRGTDIKLSDEALALGGLYVIGTEKHESRRIDNQLRGRSGRQGDVGTSQFYISVDDNVMRVFGGDKVQQAMAFLKVPDDMPINNSIITKALESAQKRVEGYNFDIRKHVVEYDDVMNYHREIIYTKRRAILEGEDIHNEVIVSFEKEAERIVLQNRDSDGGFDYQEILETINAVHKDEISPLSLSQIESYADEDELIELAKNYFWKSYQRLEKELEATEQLRELERQVFLRAIDGLWMNHIDEMTRLRKQVGLLGYGQRNPLIEYKKQAYERFAELLEQIGHNVVNTLFKINIAEVIKNPIFNKAKNDAS